ncbi:hypothetical protein Fuma_03884 [Fuerstiella marisgermanici]|uniref:Uncharacterized protein n=1 Tax=Fuerstiella marisgermanici TaxID=1891926 RepID=A0A1P8WJM8_9PLAN|nr:hypothetical protein Fuma_03884 [Fuerstiella marisgermanici]
MEISVTTPRRTRSTFRESVADRLAQALARFENRISEVSVTLSDTNGPRGGVDKECRVNVVMPGFDVLTTSARHENVWGAVAKATERARRIVLTKLKRPLAMRAERRDAVIPEMELSEAESTA